MPWYRITIDLKNAAPKQGIRHSSLPYPLWERKVKEEAEKAFGEDNIREIYIIRLTDDHPDVRAALKAKRLGNKL